MATSPTLNSQCGNGDDAKKTAVATEIPTGSGVIRLTRRRASATHAIQQNN